jgi:hypothetical protein
LPVCQGNKLTPRPLLLLFVIHQDYSSVHTIMLFPFRLMISNSLFLVNDSYMSYLWSVSIPTFNGSCSNFTTFISILYT